MADPDPTPAFHRFRATGDPEALAAVFDATAAELLRVASHLVPDLHAAEDLVQSTFLAAIEHRSRFSPDHTVLPWLLGILTNHARRHRSRLGRRPDPRRVARQDTQGPGPEEAAADLELSQAVSDAIQGLPEPYRPVLMLHLRHGFAPREIALDLGRSPATVRSQLARGLERLRRALPAGLAVAISSSILPTQGLAATRNVVLEAARLAAPSVATAAIAPMAPMAPMAMGGVLLMKKILLITAAILGVTSAGYLVYADWISTSTSDPEIANRASGDGQQLIPPLEDRDKGADRSGVSDRSLVSFGSALPVLRVLVRDDRQRALGGIPVFLFTNRSIVAAEGSTNTTGMVSFAVKAGRYDLYINSRGDDGAKGFGWLAEAISLGQPHAVNLERTLPRRNASLEVVVRDHLGAFVPGIEVIAHGSIRVAARTNSRGVVYINRLLPEKISVRVHRTEATPVAVAVPESLQKVVELEAGQMTSCSFNLVQTGSLHTRLDCADAHGIKPDQIRVSVDYRAGAYSHGQIGRGVTLGKTLRFEHLPPGSYAVHYLLPADSGLGIRAKEARTVVAVTSGKVTTFVAQASPRPGVVTGRVSCDGVPVVGVRMSVWGCGPNGRWQDGWQLKVGHTKKEGRFEFRGLPETPYRLSVDSHRVPGTRQFAYFGSFEKPWLKLPGSARELEITLRHGGVLKGRVVEGDKPVARGKVVLDRAWFNSELGVDLDSDTPGLFEFRHLRPGNYLLTFRRGEKVVASRKILIEDAAKPEVEIQWDVKSKD